MNLSPFDSESDTFPAARHPFFGTAEATVRGTGLRRGIVVHKEMQPNEGIGGRGFQGAQGPQGSGGSQGAQGADGAQGHQGGQGGQGPQGATGDAGSQGPQGDKGAILFARSREEIVRVVCPEMPETWLFDVALSGDAVDPVFRSIIEEDTLCAIGPSARIEGGIVTSLTKGDRILIGGIRKGFGGRRFVPQTLEQMERSNRFWSEQRA